MIEAMRERAHQGMTYIGGIVHLMDQTTRALFRKPFDLDSILYQIEAIGMRSMSVATLTAVFSGMVMTVQFVAQLARFGAKAYVGSVVSLSLVRELSPVLTALMVGGRVGAGIAAELGSMVVTEQVDAIRAMGADPVKKLVVPRVVAGLVVLPLLTAFANVVGIAAAAIIARLTADVSFTYFITATTSSVSFTDIAGGLGKTIFFGYFITLIACYHGLETHGGTEGVGTSTTSAVVATSLTTLVVDFVLTNILLGLGL